MYEQSKMFKKKKSLNLMAVVLLITAVSLAACSLPKPAQQFTLRIGVLPTQDSLPYFVMQEQGFDKKNGIQFVETMYPSGAAIIDAIVAGSLDVGAAIGSVPVLSAAERGLIPDKVIPVAANNFADSSHPGVGVIAAASVTSWQDLKGRQIAVHAVDSLHSASIKGRLEQEGVSDYKLVEISFANIGLAVAGGNVAAATMSEPFLTQSLLRKDGKLLGWVIGGPPFEKMEFTMIGFSANMYRNNPQAVKAFLRAQLQAVKWIDQNPDGARIILGKRLDLSSDVRQKINLLRFSADGRNDPALLESMQPVLVETGLLKAPIPVSQLYDETLLNEVLSERH